MLDLPVHIVGLESTSLEGHSVVAAAVSKRDSRQLEDDRCLEVVYFEGL
jgi:hypothetical protein